MLSTRGSLLLAVLAACSPTDGVREGLSEPSDTVQHPRYRAVVLVTIDTLRADHVSMHGYLRKTTPFLDELAERSVVFENAQASMPFTGPSHSSMLTGLHPFQHKVMVNGQLLSPKIPNVAQAFRDAGYRTSAFVSTGFLRSVTKSFDEVSLGKRTGRATVKQAMQWAEELEPGTPFFMWVHLFNVHEWEVEKLKKERRPELAEGSFPLAPDAWYDYLAKHHGWPMVQATDPFPEFSWDSNGRVITSRETLLETVDLYDARVQYVDASVRLLFNKLGQVIGEDPALWLITSDHGEGLGSHNYKGHSSQIFQEQLHVPLLVFQQPALTPRRVSGVVSLVDVAPTLTAGLDPQPPAWESLSLWPLILGQQSRFSRPAFAQRSPVGSAGDVFALIHEGQKYLYRAKHQDAFYDLASDPQELNSNPDAPGAEATRAMLHAQLRALDWSVAGQNTDISDLPEDILQELKALGYVE
jgi:arylsulfatase A-like enzyme